MADAERVTQPIAPHAQSTPRVPAQTAAWTVAGIISLLWGLRLWGYGTLVPAVVVPGLVLSAWGLFLMSAAWIPGVLSGRRGSWILAITIGLTVVALALWSYTQVFTVPAYGTDEMAFDQYAAQLFLHGIDPFRRSMGPAFAQFQVSPNGYTFQLNGTPVTALS
jgi:uncharacterized membrane protein